jgi:predicted site-specific integrase-resolvase
MNFAFYGQATTTDRGAARLVRARQRAEAATRVQRLGGQIVAEYFDVYRDRYTGLSYRRQAHRLLHAIEDERRAFDALVIVDTRTALTAMQYDDLQFICHEHNVQLWVPHGPVVLSVCPV